MRNTLAWIGALTISSCSGTTAVACGNSENFANTILDWNKTMQQFDGVDGKTMTAEDFLTMIGKNLNATQAGKDLYSDLISYTALSAVKTNKKIFKEQYDFARLAVTNQIKNYQNSLKAKYGRSWEGHWKDFLKDPAQGGDGVTGSVEKWTDVLLKSKATDIVKSYYVSDNFHDFSYYSPTEISIWSKDMYDFYQKNHTINGYDGPYKAKEWIVAYAISDNPTFSDVQSKIEEIINGAFNNAATNPINLVPRTLNDKAPASDSNPGSFVTDGSKMINGLLSDQQLKIAKVWTQNQSPIWTKQIVIPFNKSVTDPLKKPIDEKDFSDNNPLIDNVFSTIATDGFETALQNYGGGDKPVTDSVNSGDLGLNLKLTANASIKPSFQYYVYRYVLSQQGAGTKNDQIAPYDIPTIDASGVSTKDDTFKNLIGAVNRTTYTKDDTFKNLIGAVNRTTYTNDNTGVSGNHTSIYNDEIVVTTPATTKDPEAGQNGQGLATFIDQDGLHIVQARGITYKPKYSGGTGNINTDILNYNRKLIADPKSMKFEDAEMLTNRTNGLVQNPYLSYLQSSFLKQTWINGATKYFDLNSEISTFATGTDINSATWWDYLLYCDNNINKINWNGMKSGSGISNLLGFNISANQNDISNFVEALRTWFLGTKNNRSNKLQVDNSATALKNAVNKANDDLISDNAPPARMDADSIFTYITKLGAQTLWWYNQNEIFN